MTSCRRGRGGPTVPSHRVEGATDHGRGHRPQGTEMAGGESFLFGGAGKFPEGKKVSTGPEFGERPQGRRCRVGAKPPEEGPEGEAQSRAHPRLPPMLARPLATDKGPHRPAAEGQGQVSVCSPHSVQTSVFKQGGKSVPGEDTAPGHNL